MEEGSRLAVDAEDATALEELGRESRPAAEGLAIGSRGGALRWAIASDTSCDIRCSRMARRRRCGTRIPSCPYFDSLQPRIEGIAQAFAHQIVGNDRDENRHPWEDGEPPGERVAAGIVQNRPPGYGVSRHADAQKLSPDSVRIADAMPSTTDTITGARA